MVLLIAFPIKMKAQTIKNYPIPSYNIITNGSANFLEYSSKNHDEQSRGKKTMNVASSGSNSVPSQIWIISLDGQTVMGPYSLDPGGTISVEIDDREWGVHVESEGEVILSVWIESISNPPPGKLVMQPSKRLIHEYFISNTLS